MSREMNGVFRDLVIDDLTTVFDVRAATIENPFSRKALYSIGITEDSVREMLASTHRGWVCQYNNQVVGFSIADGSTGELWVIAVLPAFEGKGIGSGLLALAEDWLWTRDCREIWLWTSTNPELRAYRFYRKHGWVDSQMRDG